MWSQAPRSTSVTWTASRFYIQAAAPSPFFFLCMYVMHCNTIFFSARSVKSVGKYPPHPLFFLSWRAIHSCTHPPGGGNRRGLMKYIYMYILIRYLEKIKIKIRSINFMPMPLWQTDREQQQRRRWGGTSTYLAQTFLLRPHHVSHEPSLASSLCLPSITATLGHLVFSSSRPSRLHKAMARHGSNKIK